jgi:hypothetical protein
MPFALQGGFAIAGCLVMLVDESSAVGADSSGRPEVVDPGVRPAGNALPASRGIQLGLRFGIAHPGGAVGGGPTATTPNVGDVAQTWLPLALDGGYRVSPGAYVGASLVWGPVVGDDNALCAACGFRYDVQAEASVRLYPFPNSTLSPWISYGAGWELLHLAFVDPSSPTAAYQGPILGDFQVGLDVRSGGIAAGPYFSVEFAEFVARSVDPAPPGETSIDAHAVHEWFTVGLRGSYGPWALCKRCGSF